LKTRHFSADNPPDSKRNRRKAGKTKGIFFSKNSFKNIPESFSADGLSDSKRNRRKAGKTEEIFFSKKFLQKQPGKVFPRMACPIPKGIDEKPEKPREYFFQKILSKTARKSFSADGLSDSKRNR